MTSRRFDHCVLDALVARAVPSLVEKSPQTVVLERLAFGAGQTRWFLITAREQLTGLVSTISPGSSVSFYFGTQFSVARYGRDVEEAILRIAERDGGAVLARQITGEIELDADFPSGPVELSEIAERFAGADVVYGRFPGREDDGRSAVTLDMPDEDGIVRPHPH